MADLERELEQPGAGAQAPETTERWVHRHGAAGERVAKYPGDPDPELSFTGIVWTAVGIAGTTVVAMVLMVWMMGGLGDLLSAREPAPTPAELERREAVRRAGEERIATESMPSPGLVLPPELEVPPGPALEVHPTWNLDELRKVEKDLLEGWAVDEETGTVRIPIDTAIELAAAGELPGVPRGSAEDGEDAGATPETGGTDEVVASGAENAAGATGEGEAVQEPAAGPAAEDHDGAH